MKTSWQGTLGLLAGAQALSQSISVFVLTISSSAAGQLVRDPLWVTLPLAFLFLGTLAALFPLGRLMAHRGRRSGFRWAGLLGLLGALAGISGLLLGNFLIFLVGHFLMGAQQGGFQFLRFAAGEAVPKNHQAQGISWVLAGGVLAAFLGPWLAHGIRSLGLESSAYLLYSPLVILYVLLILLMVLVPILKVYTPEGTMALPQTEPPRPLKSILGQKAYLQALGGSILAYALMIFFMTATPPAMDHAGHSSPETSWVIQWHVLGMFVPSFFTGTLIQRWGAPRVILLGLVALGADALGILFIPGFLGYWIGLTLLGVGWNFVYIGSTTRLTQTYRPAEKESAQAFHDFGVFAVSVGASYGAAPLLALAGWQTLNIWMLPIVILGGVLILRGSKTPAKESPR